jgi:hypothetical protein
VIMKPPNRSIEEHRRPRIGDGSGPVPGAGDGTSVCASRVVPSPLTPSPGVARPPEAASDLTYKTMEPSYVAGSPSMNENKIEPFAPFRSPVPLMKRC